MCETRKVFVRVSKIVKYDLDFLIQVPEIANEKNRILEDIIMDQVIDYFNAGDESFENGSSIVIDRFWLVGDTNDEE